MSIKDKSYNKIKIEGKDKGEQKVPVNFIQKISKVPWIIKLFLFIKWCSKYPVINILYLLAILPTLIWIWFQYFYLFLFNWLIFFSWQQIFYDLWLIWTPIFLLASLTLFSIFIWIFTIREIKLSYRNNYASAIDVNLNFKLYNYLNKYFINSNKSYDFQNQKKLSTFKLKNISISIDWLKKINRNNINYKIYFKSFIQQWHGLLILIAVFLIFYINVNLVRLVINPNPITLCYISNNEKICNKDVYIYGNDKWIILSSDNITTILKGNQTNKYKILPISEITEILKNK
ncbi:MAG: hypothetical protein ACD_2C00003G0003 [uncultured bacterium (gcode 4)]|uniref:Uncharacterized protein n=1 Tax=uncultured bacterium (gcode 4) TaxID=1234023 RepID=K2G7I0_9BACT|nr:MAG: hypothetical protein ACD_2C00003G0003 [uncultured bacterium (gcode 4)]